MRRWQMMQRGLQSLFLVALILAGCSAPGSDNPAEGCGGTEAAVSCLDIVSIAPTPSSNVDAHQNICINSTTGMVTAVELFTDHNVSIAFANTQFPTALSSFDIRIIGFSVSYRLNQCPAMARGCPPLAGFTVLGESILVRAGGTVTDTFPFVPLRVKDAYAAAGGELFSTFLPSYTATYVFTAETTRFNDTFTVSGSAEFTMGDFLEAGFTCDAPGVIR